MFNDKQSNTQHESPETFLEFLQNKYKFTMMLDVPNMVPYCCNLAPGVRLKIFASH